jgi:hypothetical protein
MHNHWNEPFQMMTCTREREREREEREREREREASATILPSGGTLLPMLWAELFFVHV